MKTQTPAMVKTIAYVGQHEDFQWAKSGERVVHEKFVREVVDEIRARLLDRLLDIPEVRFSCNYVLGGEEMKSYFNYKIEIEQSFPSLDLLDPEIFIYDLVDMLPAEEFYLESLDISDNL